MAFFYWVVFQWLVKRANRPLSRFEGNCPWTRRPDNTDFQLNQCSFKKDVSLAFLHGRLWCPGTGLGWMQPCLWWGGGKSFKHKAIQDGPCCPENDSLFFGGCRDVTWVLLTLSGLHYQSASPWGNVVSLREVPRRTETMSWAHPITATKVWKCQHCWPLAPHCIANSHGTLPEPYKDSPTKTQSHKPDPSTFGRHTFGLALGIDCIIGRDYHNNPWKKGNFATALHALPVVDGRGQLNSM